MIQSGECKRPTTIGMVKKKYSGALVLEPEPKSYTIPIEIFDVKGLYPAVMIHYNLSFETVCCGCCKHDPAARVVIWKKSYPICDHFEHKLAIAIAT
jgi:DNA polymerase elongation subunit (family B)